MADSQQSVTVWWITTDLQRDGEKIEGPFLTEEQALGGREIIERREGHERLWVRSEETTIEAVLEAIR